MVSGPAWQPPTAVKSWPGAAGRDESNLQFKPGCRRLRSAREKATAAGSDKRSHYGTPPKYAAAAADEGELRGGVSIWSCISPTIRIMD